MSLFTKNINSRITKSGFILGTMKAPYLTIAFSLRYSTADQSDGPNNPQTNIVSNLARNIFAGLSSVCYFRVWRKTLLPLVCLFSLGNMFLLQRQNNDLKSHAGDSAGVAPGVKMAKQATLGIFSM